MTIFWWLPDHIILRNVANLFINKNGIYKALENCILILFIIFKLEATKLLKSIPDINTFTECSG